MYFLVGTNPETDKPRIYIGQTAPRQNGVAFARAAEHSRSADKDFFNRIIYVVVVDDSWGATEITFLENAFHQRAIKAGRYEVANGNTPSAGSVSEETQAELDEFIENTNLIISALGVSAFQPKATSSKSRTSTNTASASARPSDDEEPVFELHRSQPRCSRLGPAHHFWFPRPRGIHVAAEAASQRPARGPRYPGALRGPDPRQHADLRLGVHQPVRRSGVPGGRCRKWQNDVAPAG